MRLGFSLRFNQRIKYRILALVSSVLICIASCASFKPPPKTHRTSLTFEGQKKQMVFTSFKKLFEHKGVSIITDSMEKGLIVTDWLYFSKPGSNWRFRYNLVLSFADDESDTIQVSVATRYQRGILLRQHPFSPNPIGYDWDDISPDQYLTRNLNAFLMSLKTSIMPMRSNIIFENPQNIRKVIFRLSGISPETIKRFPHDDGTQTILNLDNESVLIQTTSRIFLEKEAIPIPIIEERFSQFLNPTVFCQSDDPLIKEMLKLIIGNEKNSWRAVKKICAWLKQVIIPTYNFSFSSAKEVLDALEGDCTEFTVLAAAFCRAAGIPARAVVGIMYDGGIFNYHMWLEVYIGQWISMDPQFFSIDESSGEYYTDATHLKFFRIDLGENTLNYMNQVMVDITGKLKLEILDYSEEI